MFLYYFVFFLIFEKLIYKETNIFNDKFVDNFTGARTFRFSNFVCERITH